MTSQGLRKAGFSTVEALIALVLLAISALAFTQMAGTFSSGLANSRAQFGDQSLRSALSMTLSNPQLCTAALDRTRPFDRYAAYLNSLTYGYQLDVNLPDGTSVNSFLTLPNAPLSAASVLALPNYSTYLHCIVFESAGNPAGPIPGLVDYNPGPDPQCADLNNSVYDGDIRIDTVKTTGPTIDGGATVKTAYLENLMLTVENGPPPNGGHICRCYAPDPCTALGGHYNPNNNPSCTFCASNQTWVGNSPTGAPICLPTCAAGHFLVSDGTGFGAICR